MRPSASPPSRRGARSSARLRSEPVAGTPRGPPGVAFSRAASPPGGAGALGLGSGGPGVTRTAAARGFSPPPAAPRAPLDGRPVRLITTSWSDNPNKGAATLARLEELLDPARFELTFVGRSQVTFRRVRVVPPVGSERVAELLREHDAFVMPSQHEACSNALLAARACRLPAAYVASGGDAELVGEGGVPFAGDEDVAAAGERLARPAA